MRFCFLWPTVLLLACSAGLLAETITLNPSADTTLFELDPDFNFGAQPDLPIGTLGTAANLSKSRGLFRFDLAGKIPTNAIIQSAKLVLTVTKTPTDAPANSNFGLHRMLRDWAEGTKRGVESPGGAQASPNDSTWKARFFPDQLWAAAGGTAGVDYLAAASAATRIVGNGSYAFGSTTNLARDVADWLANPGMNFGWMLITESESTAKTARRFGSREHPTRPPVLEIQYSAPIGLPQQPRITAISWNNREASIRFTVEAGVSYTLEGRSDFATGAWQAIATALSLQDGETTLIDPAAVPPQRVYRIAATRLAP